MAGYRNLTLGILYLGVCVYFGFVAGSAQLAEMGSTFISLGLGVTGVVAGRGFNKMAEAKNGAAQ